MVDLSAFDGSSRSIAVIQKVLNRLRTEDGFSQARIARALNYFIEQHGAEHGLVISAISQQAVSAFLSRRADRRGRNPDLPLAMWLWLYQTFPGMFEQEALTVAFSSAFKNDVAASIHGQLSPGRAPLVEDLARLEGRYLVYRRFHLDPEKLVIGELHCGGNEDASKFKLVTEYEGLLGQAAVDVVEGYAVPYDQGIFLQGVFVGTGGPCVLAMSKPSIDAGSKRVSRCEGVALVGASGDRPSAYPLLIVRSERDVVLGVYEMDAIMEDKNLWAILGPVMDRGHVEWRN